jgi:hypothetical protein
VILSHVFPPILHNIRLYIYTVRYISSIKILCFLRNVSNFFFENSKKKSQNFLKLISFFKKKKFYFHAYSRILKVFKHIFIKKQKVASCSCFKNAKKKKRISWLIYSYPLGFGQNIKNPSAIILFTLYLKY